jgi:hypothetical protein
MSRSGFRREARGRRRMESRRFRHGLPPATFEFVELRKGGRCVPAVEIVAGSQSVVDEIPEDMDRTALARWLAAQGLAQIPRRGGSE